MKTEFYTREMGLLPQNDLFCEDRKWPIWGADYVWSLKGLPVITYGFTSKYTHCHTLYACMNQYFHFIFNDGFKFKHFFTIGFIHRILPHLPKNTEREETGLWNVQFLTAVKWNRTRISSSYWSRSHDVPFGAANYWLHCANDRFSPYFL